MKAVLLLIFSITAATFGASLERTTEDTDEAQNVEEESAEDTAKEQIAEGLLEPAEPKGPPSGPAEPKGPPAGPQELQGAPEGRMADAWKHHHHHNPGLAFAEVLIAGAIIEEELFLLDEFLG